MTHPPSMPGLRAFLAVARLGNFSEAARSLAISQPALSRTIRLLEEHLGVRLFDRDTRSVTLTVAGNALLPVVDRLTGDFDHAFAELAQNFAGRRGRVVVGALPSMAAKLLPGLIRTFQHDNPLVEIVVRDTLSGTLERQFQERQIDLALIALSQNIDALVFTEIMTEPFGLVCAVGSVLDRSEPADWNIFNDRPFIAMAPMSSVRTATDTAFAQAGITVPALFECAHLATVGGFIEAGLGVSALPRSTLPLLGCPDIVWRPLRSPTVNRTIGLARLAGRSLAPAAQAFADHIVAHSAHMLGGLPCSHS